MSIQREYGERSLFEKSEPDLDSIPIGTRCPKSFPNPFPSPQHSRVCLSTMTMLAASILHLVT